MNKRYCKYHPLSPALWWSEEFQTGYCERCVDYSESSLGSPKAKNFLTGNSLEYLGSAHSATPFWERIPQFFKYPLNGDAVIFVVAVMILGSLLTAMGGIVALAGLLLSLAAITKYGFMVIEQTSKGSFTPPPWDKAFTGDMNMFLKQVGVQIMFGAFLVVVGMLEIPSLSLLSTLIVILVLPASIMVLAMEEDVSSAVNPGFLFSFISRIGGAYFILYVFLIFFSFAHLGFFSLLMNELPESWLGPLFVSSSVYFLLVMYHLMGYVIFQYQSELGFVSEDERTAQRRMKAIDPFDSRIEVFLKEGRYDDAIRVFKKGIGQHPNDFKKHDNLSKLLVAMGNKEAALEHADSYMTKLHQVGDDARLYFLFSFYQQVDSNYVPDDPSVKYVLAEQFYSRGKYDLVIKLLKNFHKQYPNYPNIGGAYHLLAEALFYGKNLPDKALQFLGFILHHYSDYDRIQEVQALAKEIKVASS